MAIPEAPLGNIPPENLTEIHWCHHPSLPVTSIGPSRSKTHLSPVFQIGASIFSCANTMAGRNTINHPKQATFFILPPSFPPDEDKNGSKEAKYSSGAY